MWRRPKGHEIDPEDIFLDSSNRPGLDAHQLEGMIERPVSHGAIAAVGGVFVLAALVFIGQSFMLQVVHGDTYADISRNNLLERSVLFASRGVLYDRNGIELAWNSPSASSTPFAERSYTTRQGFAHLLGYVRYPKADQAGAWWREEYTGISGSERAFDSTLAGRNGSRMSETNARGELVREDIVDAPKDGKSIKLSIDVDVQETLARVLSEHARVHRFEGGAAVIMDVHSGELLAMTSFPEYDNAAFARGEKEAITSAMDDPRKPLLNRAVAGLYTPGSIVKPFFAAAAFDEKIITPEKEILSTGSIAIPNPYDASAPSIFKDWKAHGYVDMRHAIAVSSDIYFYAVGGGIPAGVDGISSMGGLGIQLIDDYASRFGFGKPVDFVFGGDAAGTIPTPEWKTLVFKDAWRLGDTYNTVIGQYGFQVTPLQIVRAIAAIANGGDLLKPHLNAGAKGEARVAAISPEALTIVREGMRLAVTGGTAAALNMGGISIAAKTGTAQTGMRNQFMNSWVVGFWPSDAPRYAFAVVLEKAPAGTAAGAAPALAPFFFWLRESKPDYIGK